MRRANGRITALGLALMLGLAGCGDGAGSADGSGEAGAQLTVEELGELGGRIYAEPERSEELLEEAGVMREEFEVRIREISEDPEQARRYTAAFDAVVAESGVEVEAELDTGSGGSPET